MGLKEIEWGQELVCVDQVRDGWLALANAVMNIRVP
jgi:hypothetical protein